jgi:hypothetical protein
MSEGLPAWVASGNNNNINTTSNGTTRNKVMNSRDPSTKAMGKMDASGLDSVADKTQYIADQLRRIYEKSVLPVEKRYRYDYFYESPYMTAVEFDGTCVRLYTVTIRIASKL